MIIQKIISGGQTGADQAGLFAAVKFGIEIGGWAPKGWETSNGPKPEELSSLGLKEFPVEGYPARTHANARDSDGTIIFTFREDSPGTRCTIKGCEKYSRPYLLILLNDTTKYSMGANETKDFIDWIEKHQIATLNVAGNRETKTNNMFRIVYERMICYLDDLDLHNRRRKVKS